MNIIHRLTTIAALGAAVFATSPSLRAGEDLAPIKAEITKRHDEALKRLQDWIKLPSIAAENLNSAEGAEYMAKLAKDAGFQQATVIQTDGKLDPASSAVHVGTVKWFDEARGFGWISWEGGPDAYVHYRNIEDEGFKTLQEGQKVQFEIDPVRRGPRQPPGDTRPGNLTRPAPEHLGQRSLLAMGFRSHGRRASAEFLGAPVVQIFL